jgi:ABC-type nitrate/sulfonate/bicarbonate transport system substrate-binding protein
MVIERVSGRHPLIAGCLAAVLVAACGTGAASPTPTAGQSASGTPAASSPSGSVALQHLRSAVTTAGAIQWPYYVAQQNDWYKQAGIDFENIVAGTNTKEVQGLLAGSLDVAGGSPDVLIKAVAENNSNLVIVGSVTNRPVYTLIAQPDVHSYADLKGKQVGVSNVLSFDGLWMKQLLESHGLTSSDYQMVAIGGTADRYKALIAKGVAASLLSQPQDFQAEGKGFTVLGASTDIVKSIVWSGYNTTRAFATQHTDLLKAFLGVQCRAAKWLYDPANKAAAISLLIKNTNAAQADAEKTYDLWINQKSLSADGSSNNEAVQAMIDALVGTQQIKSAIAVDKVFDPSYMNDVVANDC